MTNNEAIELPEVFPFERGWCIPNQDVGRYLALQDNWKASADTIRRISERLSAGEFSDSLRTIGAAGSLGRMEASGQSDADLIIILRDSLNPDSTEASEIYSAVWDHLVELDIERPNPTGVFSQPCTLNQICGDTVGRADESLGVFGKRLLLLLETQPVLGIEQFNIVLNDIVARYATHYVAEDPKKEWAFLMNDLIRYFRALCVNYQWDFDNRPSKWALRNVKLRHSRLIMYGGLLALLGEASKERVDKVKWLKERLLLTPLERLGLVYASNKDWNFHRVTGLYNTFLSRINDPEVRRAFQAGDEPDDYDERFKNNLYGELKANSDGLVAELLRFFFARRADWSERFYEYLIF